MNYNIKPKLILVGSKKQNFEHTFNLVKKLNLEDQISWLGYIPTEELPYLYKMSTALVMPTLFESVSIPIWEAFTIGTPVVASDVCALPEQVGKAGILFNPNDINDMAEKIYEILINNKLRKQCVENGFERIRDFNLKSYAKRWESIIEK